MFCTRAPNTHTRTRVVADDGVALHTGRREDDQLWARVAVRAEAALQAQLEAAWGKCGNRMGAVGWLGCGWGGECFDPGGVRLYNHPGNPPPIDQPNESAGTSSGRAPSPDAPGW